MESHPNSPREMTVNCLRSVQYREYPRGIAYQGGHHPCWELLYVDKGDLEVVTDHARCRIRQGDAVLVCPGDGFRLSANGSTAPNLVVAFFECVSPALIGQDSHTFRCTEAERQLVARMVKEARAAAPPPGGGASARRRGKIPFAAQEMVVLLLEQLLINLRRRGERQRPSPKISSSAKQRSERDLVDRVVSFMEDHLTDKLTFADVCYFSAQSATNLKIIFKTVTGYGVMEYYRRLKIERAKRMLREGDGNVTQIADRLGYTSVHYFSRYFKRQTGMSPSEYALSIKANMRE